MSSQDRKIEQLEEELSNLKLSKKLRQYTEQKFGGKREKWQSFTI